MSDSAAEELREIEEHLQQLADGRPLSGKLVQELQTMTEELRVANAELSRQNDELVSLHESLAADARRFELFFEAAPIAYLATNQGGVIVEANEAAARLVGSEPRFLAGKPLVTFLDVDRRREFRTRLHDLAAGGPRIDLPLRLRRRDGVAFDAIVSAVAVRDGILWAIADQTALAQAERQLWELNQELEQRVADQTAEIDAVLEQLPIGVAVLRAGRVVRANSHAQKILAAVGVERFVAEVADSDGVRRLSLDGRVVEIDSVVVRDRTVSTVADVTTESQREQAERDFVANAAHQIRTPITVIASVVGALHAGGKDDPATLGRFLDHIDSAVTRLAGIAEALLTLARVQRGAEAPVKIVALSHVLEQATEGRELQVVCDELAATVADPALLVEAVSNVVENAFEHGGGDVTVTATVEGRRAVIEVRDRGPGIPAAERAQALQRFWGRGSGLGLSISSEAVAGLGGRLELLDAAGGGLLVRITLPGAKLL